MITTKKHWYIESPITPEAEKELKGYPPVIRQILFNRGYATLNDAQIFLGREKPSGTSPQNLSGIPDATKRIIDAIKQKEKIVIYGDYDVDGVTATVLLKQFLISQGGDVYSYIPNRFDEGYGLNIAAIEQIRELGTSLIITVDCGIRSINEIAYAHDKGLDVIITDHHSPGHEVPGASAVINPKLPDDIYPDKDLAGVGIAYKLIEGLSIEFGLNREEYERYLDLVALGTVADLAPLLGENRYLVHKGLEYIRKPNRQGVMSLIGVSGLRPDRISSSDIGFVLGPRLNAAGRLDSAETALELLSTNEIQKAGKLAQSLDNQNRERQKITKDIQEHAEKLISAIYPDQYLIVAIDPGYNPGVVGLAASRLTEKYYRPSIVGNKESSHTRASCRSIKEFHITNALDKCSDILEHYGGHAAAAGFTIRNENIDELVDRLNLIAYEQLAGLELIPTLKVDIDIDLPSLDPKIVGYLNWLQPTGYGNPEPLFLSRNLKVVTSRTVGRDNTHLKFAVTDGWITYDAIAFRQGAWHQNMPKYVDIVYSFEINEFRGQKNLQLNVKDIKPAR
jgi:single-stranded-DNA-specific exonuclease